MAMFSQWRFEPPLKVLRITLEIGGSYDEQADPEVGSGDMSRSRILVIEDDEEIRDFIALELGYEGYEVLIESEGPAGLLAIRRHNPDLVILDWMLPGMDGLELCRRLRQTSDVPVLMLTARGQVLDRVAGLDAGADDYLAKPFDLVELLARIRAQLRKRQPRERTRFEVGNLSLDTVTRDVRRGDRPIKLSVKEFDLLLFLMKHSPEVLTRERILDAVWGYDFGGDANVLEVYIRYLRQKIEEKGEPRLLHTVRGVGYVLREE